MSSVLGLSSNCTESKCDLVFTRLGTTTTSMPMLSAIGISKVRFQFQFVKCKKFDIRFWNLISIFSLKRWSYVADFKSASSRTCFPNEGKSFVGNWRMQRLLFQISNFINWTNCLWRKLSKSLWSWIIWWSQRCF